MVSSKSLELNPASDDTETIPPLDLDSTEESPATSPDTADFVDAVSNMDDNRVSVNSLDEDSEDEAPISEAKAVDERVVSQSDLDSKSIDISDHESIPDDAILKQDSESIVSSARHSLDEEKNEVILDHDSKEAGLSSNPFTNVDTIAHVDSDSNIDPLDVECKSINATRTLDFHSNSSGTATPFGLDSDSTETVIQQDIERGRITCSFGAPNPLTWPRWRKMLIVVNVSALAAVMQMSSSVLAPAIGEVFNEFQKPNTGFLPTLVVSIPLLGTAFGLLLISSLSEVWGRVPILKVYNVFFVVFAIAAARAGSITQLIVFRFFLGFSAAAPSSTGAGIVADLFSPGELATATSLYAIGNMIGPVIGPIIGAVVAQFLGWRWTMYIQAILGGAILFFSLVVLRESYRPVLIEWAAKKHTQRLEEPVIQKHHHHLPTFNKSDSKESFKKTWHALAESFVRPTKLLVTSPIVFLPSFGVAVIFGLFILLLSTMSSVFQTHYQFSIGSTGLAYLGFFVSLILANFAVGMFGDWAYKNAVRKNGGETPPPEIRLMPITLAVPFTCIGLLMYGWGVEKGVHWMVPILGTAMFGAGLITFMVPVKTYLIEIYGQKAATPIGAAAVLRSFVGGLLPLCASSLYSSLGYGWGSSLLAFITLMFAPLPWLFSKNGELLRRKFPPTD